MSNHDKDYPFSQSDSDSEQQLDLDPDTLGSPEAQSSRQEPRLTGFEGDEGYEEPERDTDYAALYSEEEKAEEEYFEESTESGPDEEELNQTRSIWSLTEEDEETPWGEKDEPEVEPGEDAVTENDSLAPLADTQASWEEVQEAPVDEEAFDWQDEDYPEGEEESTLQQWPLGMIIVGVVALLLLAAGGYGIIQQRSAMEEEIRQLQSSLATTASPEEVAASRTAVAEVEKRNTELQSSLDALTLDNKRLTDTVAGLETQLQAQQDAFTKQSQAPKPAPEVVKAPAPKPQTSTQTKTSPAATSSSGWFVNFGSYSQRDTAQGWASRLKPGAGKVIVSPGTKDGQTFYRVRVVGLGSRDQAQDIARKLEKEYDLSKLWVGQP